MLSVIGNGCLRKPDRLPLSRPHSRQEAPTSRLTWRQLRGGQHLLLQAGFTVGSVVVRLEGTKVEEGKKILNESGLDVVAANDLDDAAQKIVKAVAG